MDLFGSLGFSGTTLVKMINKDPRVLETDASIFVKYFKDHAFSEKQIANLTLKRPTLYLYNAQNIFKPKFEYFYSLGFSNLEVAKILSEEPYILERSLEFQIIPCIKELKRILGTNENVLKVIRACYRILECNVEELLEPNISMMLSRGVPQALVMKMFLMEPKSLLLKADRLSEILNETVKLGFDPNKFIFVLAIRCLALLSRTLWERKVEAYGSFGLSTDEIYSAFRLQPMFMIVSEKKIRKSMCFFINKLKLNPSMISKNPNLLLLSLESRIIPRCSVLQILMSKGLIKGDISLTYALRMTEKLYVEKFVSRFQDEVPDVVRAHQGMLEFQGFLH
ncbi:Mitochodrial transcription termination factor [Quillaja saponaria]|uniref:Mitochodrial transcription termination factor n=1 Tax=Quillaja saponaria TaxID=32244 RepID=A0AAD7LDE6_QUISA|nr:Mitochodrial transcription termination factor [Quillaja saponaria]